MKCKINIIIPLLLIILLIDASASEKNVNQNLFKTINTDGDETSCALTSDKKIIYFARKPKGAQNSDLYYSEYKKGKWSEPTSAAELNSDADEISPFISPDGKMILFASNRNGSLKSGSAARPSYDIYFSEKKKNKWSKPELLFGAVNTGDDETFPSMTGDRSSLFFTRTSSDDSAKSSIIRVNKKNDLWEDVHTADITNDKTVKISMAAKSSYRPGFISSGYKKGSSVRDIFFSYSSGENRGKLIEENLLNTPGDEISFFEISAGKLIISSNSESIAGSYDLSLKTISGSAPEKITNTGLTIKAEFKNYDKPDDAEILILYFNTKKTGVMPVKTETIKPGSSGIVNLTISSEIKRILALPGNENMKSFAVEIFPGRDAVIPYITIEKKEPADFRLKPVYFDFNSSDLKLADIPIIQELIEYLRKNKQVSLSIEGYADGAGNCHANISTSLNRAERIKDYLIKHGISKDRIKTTGRGFVRDNPKDTSQYNRRVEFIINK